MEENTRKQYKSEEIFVILSFFNYHIQCYSMLHLLDGLTMHYIYQFQPPRGWGVLPFFRPQVYERVGDPLVEVYERVGKSIILICKKGLADAF